MMSSSDPQASGQWVPLRFFGRIEKVEEAKKILKEIGIGFYVFGGLEIVAGLFIQTLKTSIIDGSLFVIIGFFLHRLQSRTAAVIAVLLAIVGMLVTLGNLVSKQGGTNVFLASIILLYSIRATQVSFRYYRLQRK